MKTFLMIASEYGKPRPLLLPDTAVLLPRKPFFLPEFDAEFKAYPVLALRIDRLGKGFEPRFASRYYSECAPCMSVRAEQTLWELQNLDLPWDDAFCFDNSLMLGEFEPYTPDLGFQVAVDGNVIINWDQEYLMDDINHTVSKLAERYLLRTGDLVCVGLADQGIPLHIGQRLSFGSVERRIL